TTPIKRNPVFLTHAISCRHKYPIGDGVTAHHGLPHWLSIHCRVGGFSADSRRIKNEFCAVHRINSRQFWEPLVIAGGRGDVPTCEIVDGIISRPLKEIR